MSQQPSVATLRNQFSSRRSDPDRVLYLQRSPAVRFVLIASIDVPGEWLRGQDLNLRPSGYEPDELPGCSTPRQCKNGWVGRPGGDLLSRALRRSTMGAGGFHGRVRDGIGCRPPAKATRSSSPSEFGLNSGSGLSSGSTRGSDVCCAI
jgi:hypothetical protein